MLTEDWVRSVLPAVGCLFAVGWVIGVVPGRKNVEGKKPVLMYSERWKGE